MCGRSCHRYFLVILKRFVIASHCLMFHFKNHLSISLKLHKKLQTQKYFAILLIYLYEDNSEKRKKCTQLVSEVSCLILLLRIPRYFIDREGKLSCHKPPESSPQKPAKAVESRYSNPICADTRPGADVTDEPDYCEIISDNHYDNRDSKTNTYQKPDVMASAPAVYDHLHI